MRREDELHSAVLVSEEDGDAAALEAVLKGAGWELAGGVFRGGEDDDPGLDGIEECVRERFGGAAHACEDDIRLQARGAFEQGVLALEAEIAAEEHADAVEDAVEDEDLVIRTGEAIAGRGVEDLPGPDPMTACRANEEGSVGLCGVKGVTVGLRPGAERTGDEGFEVQLLRQHRGAADVADIAVRKQERGHAAQAERTEVGSDGRVGG